MGGGPVSLRPLKKTRQRQGVSLSDELELLADLVEVAQVLAESLAVCGAGRSRTSGGGEHTQDRAPRLLASTLALIEARLRLTRQTIVGSAPPAAIAARHNRRGSVEPGDDPDVVLPLPSSPTPRRAR